MKIVYTPGKNNVLADMLSRPLGVQPEKKNVCLVSAEMPKYSYEDLRTKQMLDKELLKTIEALENEDPLEYTSWSERGYIMNNGVLFRYNPDNDSDEAQLVVPESERENIMTQSQQAIMVLTGLYRKFLLSFISLE